MFRLWHQQQQNKKKITEEKTEKQDAENEKRK